MFAAITGATSGIGEAYAESLAREGYDLVITGRREDLLKEVARRLRESHGVLVETLVGDLTEAAVEDRLHHALRAHKVEFLVNNAGSGLSTNYAAADPDKLSNLLAILAGVPSRLMTAVLPHMVAEGRGTIINVGSLAGRVAVPGSSVYVAAKSYLERLSESLALELCPEGIVVQALLPGYVRTDFHRAIPEYKSKQRNKGVIRWLEPKKVVEISMAAASRARRLAGLEKSIPRARDVVVIPGILNRLLNGLARVMPRRLIYRAAVNRDHLE